MQNNKQLYFPFKEFSAVNKKKTNKQANKRDSHVTVDG